MKEIIVNISSGRGPIECQWVVFKTLGVFQKEAKLNSINIQIINTVRGENPKTFVSVTLKIKGEKAVDFIKRWEGTIKWVGESQFRVNHKRKNWFIEIKTSLNLDNTIFDESEIVYQRTKSSGPGGQHVNKTESAIRATHVKSGLSVLVQDSRSQHQNKKIALERLKEIFEQNKKNQIENSKTKQWKNNINIERGNPIRVYKGEKFNLLKKK